jgi:spermidine/putrescine transport system permease protein
VATFCAAIWLTFTLPLTLPVFIFSMIRRGVKPEINAIATLLILASVLIAALGLWLRSRKIDK